MNPQPLGRSRPLLSIGVDVGGTKIAAGLVDSDGRIVRSLRADCPRQVSEIVDQIVTMVRELRREVTVVSVGVAAAGFIDAERTAIVHGPNIDWSGPPLKRWLERRIGLPIELDNDANAAGWAEYAFGAAAGARSAVMLTVGTGIGGAIVADGVLVRGAHGMAAELGHLVVRPGGTSCGCGKRGCLEQYASGTALERIASRVASDDIIGGGLRRSVDSHGRIRGNAIADLVGVRDKGALLAVETIGAVLGEACASIQAILDPDVIVVGGGVAELGDDLLTPVRRSYEQNLPSFEGRAESRLVIASLRNHAGTIGIADLARRQARTAIRNQRNRKLEASAT